MIQLPPPLMRTIRTLPALLGLTIFLPAHLSMAGQETINLRSAVTFAALASSTVTTIPTTTINGDVGVSPGTSVTGAPIVAGSQHLGDPIAEQALADALTAYNDAAGRNVDPILISGNIGGLTLAPGLYRSSSSLAISSGDLTLDGQGDPNAVWIFQMASTLTTTSGRLIILTGGANANNIFWQVGSSATLGTTSDFKGTILAFQNLTMNTGATLRGRVIALNGGVALDANTLRLPNNAPTSVAGYTFVNTILNGSGTLPGSGQFQLATATGSKMTYLLAPLSGNTPSGSSNYSYDRPTGVVSTLTYGNVTMDLVFRDRTSGEYSSTTSGGTQTGTFVMSRTLPDVNNDGLGDIYFKGGNEVLRAWQMKGTEYLLEVLIRNGAPATGLKVVGQGDINGDGHADLVFQTKLTGSMVVWFMNGTSFLSSAPLANGNIPPAGWIPVAIADFNADRKPDILLQTQDHAAVVWTLNGVSFTGSASLRGGAARGEPWTIVGTGDFNGDLRADVIWQNLDGRVTAWNMDGLEFLSASLLQTGPDRASGWRIRGVADFDFDGKTDLLYQNDDGRTDFWFYEDATFLGTETGRNVGNTSQKIIGPN